MKASELAKYIDHTLLKPDATAAQIRKLCDEAKTYRFASVCVNPCRIALAAQELAGTDVAPCCVVGFPLGAIPTESKAAETRVAVKNGAREVDMVINIGQAKDGQWDEVEKDIAAVKEACGDAKLKVIIETCLLTDDEKIKMCEIVSASGADYIKTSTGFSTAGATFHDVELFAAHVTNGVKIKAAGGISSLDDAEKFIELGASRLGTSRVVKIVKKLEAEEK